MWTPSSPNLSSNNPVNYWDVELPELNENPESVFARETFLIYYLEVAGLDFSRGVCSN